MSPSKEEPQIIAYCFHQSHLLLSLISVVQHVFPSQNTDLQFQIHLFIFIHLTNKNVLLT